MPLVQILAEINSNPRTESKQNLANKFNEIPRFSSDDKLTGEYQPEESETVLIKDFVLKLEENGMKFDLNIESGILLSQQYSKATIMDFYSKLFNPESDQKISDKTYSKIEYNSELFLEMVNLLISTQYNGFDIIVDENINPKVLQILKTKFNNGEVFTNLEPLIADVGCYLLGGFRNDGMVNSESDFNENSFEKAEQNLRRLKVLSESMSGISELQPGAEVPMRLMPEGTQYEKGDIIVFYRDDIKIVHQVEYVHESNGKTYYVTTGVNTETNQYVDNSLVSQDDVIGVVDLSKEAYTALNEMMARRYVPSIRAFGMTQNLEVELTNFVEKKEAVLQNALNRAKEEARERGLLLVSPNDPNKELSFEEFTMACIESYNPGKNKFYGDAILTWKHEKCGHIWENTYNNIKRNVGTCPKCDGQYINQKLTNAICEYIFKELGYISNGYQIEYGLTKIFPELEGLIHANVHVDGYVELNIEDKNGNLIKLAIEYQGQQHDPDPKIGFEAYRAISKQLKLKEGTTEYDKLLKDWESLIERDETKVKLFESMNEDSFYLIVVNHDLEPYERQAFILDEFKRQTGIDLNVPYIDWRKL